MLFGISIRNYFKRTGIDEWDYKIFNRFMKDLGYTKDDAISRVYIRLLKEYLSDKEMDDDKKQVVRKLLKRINEEQVTDEHVEVNVLFLNKLFFYVCNIF